MNPELALAQHIRQDKLAHRVRDYIRAMPFGDINRALVLLAHNITAAFAARAALRRFFHSRPGDTTFDRYHYGVGP